MPSVHAALHVLEEQGLVVHERYGHVELTAKGTETARSIYASHVLLLDFLTRILGVPAEVARQDACKIEHVISKETIERIQLFSKQFPGNKSVKVRT